MNVWFQQSFINYDSSIFLVVLNSGENKLFSHFNKITINYLKN